MCSIVEKRFKKMKIRGYIFFKSHDSGIYCNLRLIFIGNKILTPIGLELTQKPNKPKPLPTEPHVTSLNFLLAFFYFLPILFLQKI